MRSIIESFAGEFRRYRRLGEGALAQVEDAHLHRAVGGDDDQSLATLAQHVGGNLRSRFIDFLGEDGEKPWRNRDGEFVDARHPRAEVRARWDAGWSAVETTLGPSTIPTSLAE